MFRLRLALATLLPLLVCVCGCNVISAMTYYFKPPQIQKPEFEFKNGSRVALLIEAAQPTQANPVFDAALHERVVAMLREGGSKVTVLPVEVINNLRRRQSDFRKWSLQRIGRESGADYVLYVKLDRLVIRQTPDHPMITPSVDLSMKVIDVHKPASLARIWPDNKSGRTYHCSRLGATAADEDPDAADIAARKLGYDTAFYVTMPFIKVDLEKPTPVEP